MTGAHRRTGATAGAPVGSRGPELLALAAGTVVVLVAVWANDWGRFVPDTVPDLYTAPLRLLTADLSAWQADPFLGSPQLQVGRVPVDAVLTALAATGAEPWVLVRLWRSLLLVAAVLGAHAVAREVAPADGAVVRVVCALVFIANPYVVVGASTTPTLLPYCLLPWLALGVLRALRTGRARWVAVTGLVWFAMSGIQVGVVPLLQLVALPALVVWTRSVHEVPWRALLARTAACALVWVGTSVYWLLPGFAAVGAGSGIAATTETSAAIAGPSTYAEVLRGLGMWTMYGSGPDGPFQPGFAVYLDEPVVVVAAGALPVLACLGLALSRSPARALGAYLVVCAVPVMVGLHPIEDPTWFGRLLARAFEDVPGLVALRTTNKAGGVLALGTALLVGLLAQRVAERLRAPAPRATAGVALGAVVVTACAPAALGDAYPVRLDLPAYWTHAAADLDRDPDGRTFVVPGETQARYRWGYTSSADVLTATIARSTVLRQTVPAGSREAANFLAAVDVPLNEGALPVGGLSTMARYVGADSVLVRNDTLWEQHAGGRPAVVLDQVGQDPGLVPVAAWGAAGEQTRSSDPTALLDERATAIDAAVAPLLRYDVVDPLPQVRARGVQRQLLVSGDNLALPDLVAAGAVTGSPGYRLLQGLNGAALATALADDARMVLTDTNERRRTNPSRLAGGAGPLLPADEAADPTRALGDAGDQTVAVLHGALRVSATQSGSVFGPVPTGAPRLALDGDPATGWVAGDFGSAVGQVLTLELERVTDVNVVRVRPLVTTPAALSEVVVRAGDVERRVALDRVDATEIDLGGVRADVVEVEVTGVSGEGDNGVGLAELEVEGVRTGAGARLPETLRRLDGELDDAGRAALARARVEVLLTRDQASPANPFDDGERVLDRAFWLPGEQRPAATGVVRAGPGVDETVLDDLIGADPSLRATSSSRWFDDLTTRASAAFDGDPGTAWVPGRDAVGERLTLRMPPTRVDRVVVEQASPVSDLVDLATAVRVTTGDGREVNAQLSPGRSVVELPPATGDALTDSVTLTVLSRAGQGAVVRITDVDVAGLRVVPDAARASVACAEVATVDGRSLRARVVGDAAPGTPLRFESCGSLRLGRGEHRLLATGGWVLDQVLLAPADASTTGSAAREPVLEVAQASATDLTVRPGSADEAWYLVLGEAYDPRWRAFADGTDLGPPLAVDGWSTGWRIEAGDVGAVQVRYAPQQLTVVGLGATAAVLVVALVVAVLPGRRRREPARRAARDVVGRRRTLVLVLVPVAAVLAAVAGPPGLVGAGAVAVLAAAVGAGRASRLGGVAAASLVVAATVAQVVGPTTGAVAHELAAGAVGALGLAAACVATAGSGRVRWDGDGPGDGEHAVRHRARGV